MGNRRYLPLLRVSPEVIKLPVILATFVIVSIVSLATVTSPALCPQCGKGLQANLKVTIAIEDLTRTYCCPQCARVALAALGEEAGRMQVNLTDYPTGELMPSDDAVIVVDRSKVICCSPSILAFRTRHAAQDYYKGPLTNWAECAAEFSQLSCGLCGAAVYRPTAYLVKSETSNVYTCGIICALGIAFAQRKNTEFSGFCKECGKEIEFRVVFPHKQPLVSLETIQIWQGFREGERGLAPAGCHFDFLFCTQTCLKTYAGKHPDQRYRSLKLEEATGWAVQAASLAKRGASH